MITPNLSSEQAVFSKFTPHANFMLSRYDSNCISAVLFKVIVIKARGKGLPPQRKKHLVQDAGLHHFSRHCNPRSILKIRRQLLNSENHYCSNHYWEKNKSA